MARLRNVLVGSFLVVVTCGGGLLVPGTARAAQRVPLPTEADVVTVALGAETILYGPKGIETMLPGPVDDEEVVTISVRPDGVPEEVRVRQRLVVHGLGDFRFKVSGPAQTVEALPDSESEPGLRKGAVLWQGFSADQKVLSSKMLLFPEQEETRLPLRISLEQTVDGRTASAPSTGPFSARLTIANQSANPVTVTSATGAPAELARALDAIAARLAAGERPVPGRDGVPEALTATGGEKAFTRSIPASFHVTGTLTFEDGELVGPMARGGRLQYGGGPPAVHFDGFVGSGGASSIEVSLSGDARNLGRPVLDLVARPAPPPPEAARPPGGGTWTDLVDRGGVDATRPLWNRIMMLTWGVAKLRQFDSYMGNPDPTGPVATLYRFRLAAPGPAPPTGPVADVTPEVRTSPLLAVTAIAALLLLAFAGVVLWSLL